MNVSMTDPPALIHPVLSQDTARRLRAGQCAAGVLLRSHVAVLSPLHLGLLESMSRGSGFSHTPEALHEALRCRGAQ
jgi:hypothetical protein